MVKITKEIRLTREQIIKLVNADIWEQSDKVPEGATLETEQYGEREDWEGNMLIISWNDS